MRNKIKGKNVLVTGGAGFIGSHLVDALIHAGAKKIVVVDNFFLGKMSNLSGALKKSKSLRVYKKDASNYSAMLAILKKEKVDVVFNLATKALEYSFVDPQEAFMVNVDIARTLLELLRGKIYRTLIHCSSSEAYGSAIKVPMREDHPLNPTTSYAAGKAAADLMVLSYFKMYQLDIAVIRPFNNYGPRQNEGLYAGVIPITIKRILGGQKPVLQGDGNQTRDFLFVKDTARAMLDIYENLKTRGQVINIASQKEVKISDLINRIVNAMNYKGPTLKKPARTADVMCHCGDVSLAKRLIGFKPEFSLQEGILETVAWYKENFNKISRGKKNA